MLWSIGFIILLNIIGYLVAYFGRTDKVTDVVYAVSFIGAGLIAHLQNVAVGMVYHSLFLMILLWGLRLAIYLGYRIKVWGKDHRFDEYRKTWFGLLKFWMLQTVSIIIVALPFLFVLPKQGLHFGLINTIGVIIFGVGLVIETIADIQKFRFKQQTKGQLTFISHGLWAYSRHPNYLGEWMVWMGIFIFCTPFLEGIEWLAVISPLWMYILLRYISGGNLLEKSADEKYGHLPIYQVYKENVGIFFPW